MRRLALPIGLFVLAGTILLPRLACWTPAQAAGTVRLVSGFQPGEFMPPFDVVDVTGPNKGRQLCYR